MTREQLRTTYPERIQHFQSLIRERSGTINTIALFRLIAGLAVIFFIVLGVRQQQPLFYVGSGLMVILFLVLVSRHNRHKDLRNLYRELKLLNETELDALDHKFQDLPTGQEYLDQTHPWSHDLDLFGTGSLFQYLNRTSIRSGGRHLSGLLVNEPVDQQSISRRQGIIHDLKDRIEFRQKFTARGRLIEENKDDLADIDQWRTRETYITKHRWLFYLALIIGAVAIAILVAGLFNSSNFRFLLPLILVNWVLLSPFFMRTNQYQASISRKHELLEGFAMLLRIIADSEFEHPDLLQKKRDARQGMKEVKQLSRLLNIFDQRLNMLLGVVFNLLFLFDFIMLFLLERWKHKNQDQIMEWIELTGQTDALISLAGFAYNHPGFTMPEVEDSIDKMEMMQLGHPLIPDTKRVLNDLRIKGEKVVIITGANMAGKSTYLRSLGINMVLAYAGCPVCATKFRTGFMGLYSSMRTADSLADEESYFLAEIKKLQLIVQRMETGEPLLILLDEVLKGTNTTDKKRGSVGLILRALKFPVRCFIATHDLSLGDMEGEHPEGVVNYCFESYIHDLELEFDYTIRKGIATNMNASFLMKRMGIMD